MSNAAKFVCKATYGNRLLLGMEDAISVANKPRISEEDTINAASQSHRPCQGTGHNT